MVYVGGHQRWWNNPFRGDAAGQGAVSREGIAALDPVNGLPLSWDPTRTKGVGVFDFLDTPQGLWVASDTDRIGNFQLKSRIARMLPGGTSFPAVKTTVLPNDVYTASTAGALSRRRYDAGVGAPQSPPNGGIRLGQRPRRLHDQRSAVPGEQRRVVQPALLQRHHVRRPGRCEHRRPDRGPDGLARRHPERHQHVLRPRPDLLHPDRLEPALLPVLLPGERRGRSEAVRGVQQRERHRLLAGARHVRHRHAPLLGDAGRQPAADLVAADAAGRRCRSPAPPPSSPGRARMA